MKKRKRFTAQQKAKIVLEMICGEHAVSQIVTGYEAYPNTITISPQKYYSSSVVDMILNIWQNE